MADPKTSLPLLPESIEKAYEKIKDKIHKTPLLTNATISAIASTPLQGEEKAPKVRVWFKCENMQKIGAFKARGGFHAVGRVIEQYGIEEVKRRGVITHSSGEFIKPFDLPAVETLTIGNHAQALALAASTYNVPSYIIMPTISTPSKIAGTRKYTPNVIFSGSISSEREAKVAEVQSQTDAIFVPPYDHPDIILGQGTAAYEMSQQYSAKVPLGSLRAVLTPCGGGGLLSGTVTWFSDKSTFVFGTEPSFQGANDLQRGLSSTPPTRIDTVKTLTIADGLRTPVGKIPWSVLTNGSESKPKFLQGVYSVSEDQIKKAMRLIMERMKVFIEPSSAVPLAVVLFDKEWREWVVKRQEEEGGDEWDIGIILSGGNTTMEAIAGLFGSEASEEERAEGLVGDDGGRVAENVAG